MKKRERRVRSRLQRKTRETSSKDSHLRVHLPLHLTPLTGSSSRVHDDLAIGSSEDDDSDDPGRVSKDASSKESRLEVDGVSMLFSGSSFGCFSLDDDGSVEPEHVDLGGFAVDSESSGRAGDGGSKVSEFGDGVSRLEVRLSVEVLGLDVGDVFFLRGRADDDVWMKRKRVERGRKRREGRNKGRREGFSDLELARRPGLDLTLDETGEEREKTHRLGNPRCCRS